MGCGHSVPTVAAADDAGPSTCPQPRHVVGSNTGTVKAKQAVSGAGAVAVRDNDVQPQVTSDQGNPEALQPNSSMLVVWRQPPRPLDEEDRWDTLCQMRILDTAPEEAYDSITRLCTRAFKVPVATVSFVDGDRVWFKSILGLNISSIPTNCSLCSWTVLARHPTALVVPDLKADARLSRLPLVTSAPHARFYAGAPLVASNGRVLGSLCILDFKPRDFSERDTQLLAQFATLVMKEVERREKVNDAVGRTIMEPEERRRSLAADVADDSQAMMLCDVSNPNWPILYANSAWESHTGLSRGVACGAAFWQLFLPLPARQVQAYTLATEQQRPFQLRLRCTPSDGGAAGDSALCHMAGGCSTTGRSKRVQMQFWSMNSTYGSHLQPAAAIAIPTLSNGKAAIDAASGRYYWASVVCDTLGKTPPGEGRSTASAGPNMRVGSNGSSAASGSRVGSGDYAQAHGSGGRVATGGTVARGSNGDADMSCNGQRGSSSSGVTVHPEGGSSSEPAASSTSAGAAGPADGLVGREMSVIGTSFVLLPEPEDAFSNIQLGNLLGRGAYGAVFRGRWNDSMVAVKMVDVTMQHNPHAALEPLLHTQLNHPNIVKLFGLSTREVESFTPPDGGGDWRDDNEHISRAPKVQQEVWMIMEFCNRGTLSDAIARGALAELGPDGTRMFGSVNMRRLVTTMREIASAMAYLHEQNILHGDLTGNNVMLVTDRTQRKGFAAKVSDFGLSRLMNADEQRINTRTHGTITHMAPEVITQGTHSRQADVYSFGMVMMEAYIGECPFQGMHYAQVVQHVTTGEPLAIPDDAPPELKALLQATLAHNPDDRPSFPDIHQRLCQMEAALKKADASMSLHEKLRVKSRAADAPSSPQQGLRLNTTEFSPTAQYGSATGFDTICGLASESVANAGGVAIEDPAAEVCSF